MGKKPLHLRQTRYEVRPCRVWSKRAEGGRACNYWYIHDTLTDSDTWNEPTLNRGQAFRTRREAVASLTKRLAREESRTVTE